MSGEAKTTQWFTVPAGTPATECRGCRQTVYWIITAAGHRMPVNCDVEGGLRPVRFGGVEAKDNGRGISHFVDCPQAGTFRRKG